DLLRVLRDLPRPLFPDLRRCEERELVAIVEQLADLTLKSGGVAQGHGNDPSPQSLVSLFADAGGNQEMSVLEDQVLQGRPEDLRLFLVDFGISRPALHLDGACPYLLTRFPHRGRSSVHTHSGQPGSSGAASLQTLAHQIRRRALAAIG